MYWVVARLDLTRLTCSHLHRATMAKELWDKLHHKHKARRELSSSSLAMHGFTWWSCIMASFHKPTVLPTVLQGNRANLLSKVLLPSCLHINGVNHCYLLLDGLRCKLQLLCILNILKKRCCDVTDKLTDVIDMHYDANKSSASKNFSHSITY